MSRLKGSLSYRLGPICEALLGKLPAPSTLQRKPALPLTLVMLSGEDHFPMLRESLFSLHRAWKRLPEVRIVSDGSLVLDAARRKLGWWKGKMSFITAQECLAYHRRVGNEQVVQFAQKYVRGYKLAAVLEAARRGPVLFADTDLLWFRDFAPLLPEREEEERAVLKMSEDNQCSYNEQLIEGDFDQLQSPPFFNSGVVFLAGDLLGACDLEGVVERAATLPYRYTDQTVFAVANHQLGGRHWSRDEIALQANDRFTLLPTYQGKRWAARHYARGTRHLFWRDALALRAQAVWDTRPDFLKSNGAKQ